MTAPRNRTDGLRVGYVVKTWPRLSETFILNEILALEARGVQVTVLALKRPAESRFHEKLARVSGEVHYAPELRSNQVLGLLARAGDALADCRPELARLFWRAFDDRDEEAAEGLVPAIAFLPLVRAAAIDHLHAHFATSAATVAMQLARLAGIGWSMTAHAKDIFHRTVRPEALARKLDEACFTVAVSDVSAEHLRTNVARGGGDSIRRLYNGLDLAEFAPPAFPDEDGTAAIGRRNGADGTARLLAVGRLVPKKGFGTLLSAVRLLRDAGSPVELDLVGDGEERAALEARIDTLDLRSCVRLLGARSHHDVRGLMRRSDLFALPAEIAEDGNRDGLPVVVVEAMASGLPVVSTPVVGIPEAVIDGVTGCLVPEKDPAALAGAIARLIDDVPLATRLARNARRHVERHFDGAASAATLHAWMSEAASERSRTGSAALTGVGG